MTTLSIRIDFGPNSRIGPGKIALLEMIAAEGSIAAGGRALGMSYRRAWELIDELNGIFGRPVVTPKSGGKKGAVPRSRPWVRRSFPATAPSSGPPRQRRGNRWMRSA